MCALEASHLPNTEFTSPLATCLPIYLPACYLTPQTFKSEQYLCCVPCSEVPYFVGSCAYTHSTAFRQTGTARHVGGIYVLCTYLIVGP
jgi:hypothetical protein